MLSILKWVYDLGYKHSEERIYSAFERRIRRPLYPQPFDYQVEETEKQRNEREFIERQIQERLQFVINEVIRPMQDVEIQTKLINRFDP